jgi:hypothetical protein
MTGNSYAVMRILSLRGRKRFGPNLKVARLANAGGACLNDVDNAATEEPARQEPPRRSHFRLSNERFHMVIAVFNLFFVL